LKTTYPKDSSNIYIPISCEPENDGDFDNIRNISFYPPTGIPYYYFPYWNQPNYQPPAIMMQVDIVPGTLAMLWCKFWTNTVNFDYTDLQGSIHIELMVLDNVGVN